LELAPFRSYDASIGRWSQVDPIYKFGESGYASMLNNPIGFSDPLGLDPGGGTDPVVTLPVITVTASRTSSGASSFDHLGVMLSAPPNQKGVGSLSRDDNSSSPRASGASALGMYGGLLREHYIRSSKGLKGKFTFSDGRIDYDGGKSARFNLKSQVRGLTLEPLKQWLNVNEAVKVSPKASPRFWITNRGWNAAGRFGGSLGTLGAVNSIYNVSTSDQPLLQARREGFNLGGAWLGTRAVGGIALRTKNPYVAGAIIFAGGTAGGFGGNAAVNTIENMNSSYEEINRSIYFMNLNAVPDLLRSIYN
jgi:hypothetical protein